MVSEVKQSLPLTRSSIMDLIQIKKISQSNIDEKFIADINFLLEEDNKAWDPANGNKFILNEGSALFVAESEQKLVGFAYAYKLQRFDKRSCSVLLYEIEVLNTYRHQGIGTKLIENIKNWAKEIDADEIWVLTGKDNNSAQNLYKKTGATEETSSKTVMFTYNLK